jgi:hypothetical protein
MNTIANADQLHAEVRDARGYDGHGGSCDALVPCDSCRAKSAEVRRVAHEARVERLRAEARTLSRV